MLRQLVRQPTIRQLVVLIAGASLGAVGWGAVLPFLYADIADARHLGASTAAVTFSAFALGALLAAPTAGRLADTRRPVVVATVARLAMVATIVALMYASTAVGLWVAAFGYGAALAMVQPSISVLVLALTPARRRRDAFAWQFIGQNLGLALGGLVGGYVVDLSSPTGSRPAYAFAAVCSIASAMLVAAVGRHTERAQVVVPDGGSEPGYRAVLRAPGVRSMLAVTVLLMLACYAQFDSGLPAYVLSVLHVPATTLGTAVAVNAVLVSVLTAPVVRATRTKSPAVLLATCALVWIGVWTVLAAPMLHRSSASVLVIAGYALFSVGETMLAPVLQPLAASLAPAGAAGRTLAALSAAQTFATVIGPALSGALLGLGVPALFVVVQILCCVFAIEGARRLHRVTAAPQHAAVALAG
ncbi:MFS transporter [uncultured Jatrophihabitans sp.]|uniref:MFS transporter n=1 Tax=uncultured Jatrophihabitans sp. TaxID=1610747 RepID=UPI0035CC8190